MSYQRQFATNIIMGRGDNSLKETVKLHEVVDRAVSLMSWLQQPPHPHHPQSQEEADRAVQIYDERVEELALMRLDIAVALGESTEY